MKLQSQAPCLGGTRNKINFETLITSFPAHVCRKLQFVVLHKCFSVRILCAEWTLRMEQGT